MSLRAHPVRRPLLLSLALHGLAGLVLAAAAGTGALGRKPLERVDVTLAREVEAEPEAPPPPEAPLPRVREPGEVLLEEDPPPAESDPREAADGANASAPWETRGGAIGLGGERAPRIGRRPGSAAPGPVAPPPAAAPGPEPAPAGPPVRARPLPGRCPAPPYPARERRMGVEGVVTLLVSIAPDGSVESVEVEASSGSAILDAAAVAAVRRWLFEPALADGRPVADRVRQDVRFRIDRGLAARAGE